MHAMTRGTQHQIAESPWMWCTGPSGIILNSFAIYLQTIHIRRVHQQEQVTGAQTSQKARSQVIAFAFFDKVAHE